MFVTYTVDDDLMTTGRLSILSNLLIVHWSKVSEWSPGKYSACIIILQFDFMMAHLTNSKPHQS